MHVEPLSQRNRTRRRRSGVYPPGPPPAPNLALKPILLFRIVAASGFEHKRAVVLQFLRQYAAGMIGHTDVMVLGNEIGCSLPRRLRPDSGRGSMVPKCSFDGIGREDYRHELRQQGCRTHATSHTCLFPGALAAVIALRFFCRQPFETSAHV